ncbi:MAG: NUDIX domain-containing protein [Candidatus Adlerbacteria bacterium]|nr:NUDIX domain-containing protein [Candidatus Adlerbacteria bacterium]
MTEKNVTGAGVILQTVKGTFLFQERDNNTKIFPDRIANFGGGLEQGETIIQCAVREMREELSLYLEKEDLEEIGAFPEPNMPGDYCQMFLAKRIDPSKLELHEGRSIVELTLEEALQNEKVIDFVKEVLKSL